MRFRLRRRKEGVRRRQSKDTPTLPPFFFKAKEKEKKERSEPKTIKIDGGGRSVMHLPCAREQGFLPCAQSDVHPRGVA